MNCMEYRDSRDRVMMENILIENKVPEVGGIVRGIRIPIGHFCY
jgi:hypothetical protein